MLHNKIYQTSNQKTGKDDWHWHSDTPALQMYIDKNPYIHVCGTFSLHMCQFIDFFLLVSHSVRPGELKYYSEMSLVEVFCYRKGKSSIAVLVFLNIYIYFFNICKNKKMEHKEINCTKLYFKILHHPSLHLLSFYDAFMYPM